MTDVIVIGAGLNGLVAAASLARAGLRTIVLEQAAQVGGSVVTSELAPGFRCPTFSHVAGIDASVAAAVGLAQHGIDIVRPEAQVLAMSNDDRPLVLWADCARAAREIAIFSARDAEQYPAFLNSFRRIAGMLAGVSSSLPPDLDSTSAVDLFELLKAGRAFRGLGRPDAYRLLRWMPMAVADLVAEFFESEPLRAAIAAGGIVGASAGPWSAGTGANLLLLGATERHPFGSTASARGGIGAVTSALAAAARSAGAEVRTSAAVTAIEVRDGAATGVRLQSGATITARAVVSSADARRTLLGLVDPIHLAPEILQRVRNIRANGTLAKVNLAVTALPQFSSLARRDERERQAALSGRVRLGSDIDVIERAFDASKYGRVADEPWIELTIPSIADPSLAPAGQHVVSAYVQYAPYALRGTTWDAERDRLGDLAVKTIARYAPGFERSVAAGEVITPVDLERRLGLTGGQIYQGELALDQWYLSRPMLGWSRYRTPVANLFLCGSAAHPGTGANGLSGFVAAKAIASSLRR